MKKYLFFAAAITVMASCTSDTLVNGDSEYLVNGGDANQIVFSTSTAGQTRADIAGSAAADLLGNNFYVTGTKGTEAATSPTPTLVFDNYLVHFGVNTAGTTESNTANWEYVGVTPGTSPYANYDKLSALNSQTIKYWDYSAAQYDFLAFSVGKNFKAKKDKTDPAADEIGVTAMNYGTTLASNGTAYTFYLPSEAAITKAYISDIVEVPQSNYGKEVNLKFKNLGSKVRMALYETVPGYSVKDVVFYTVDGTTDFTDASKSATAKLISANANGLPTNGSIAVYFPHVGNNNATEADYDKASATVTSPASDATYDTYKDFGALTNQLKGKDPNGYEDNSNPVYLGRSLPDATFAGNADEAFYKTVFPVSSSDPLTLRVDYTLVPIDGGVETIVVKGAKAVVPATYTKWLPNYAYTYIFKISDNTNGWTGTGSQPSGLFPITFDAVVTEATDATAEQKTITTVATPSITTYQQNHDITKDEYSKAATGPSVPGTVKDLYVQVMDNSTAPATLKGDLNGTTPTDATKRSLLYVITGTAPISEATVMDALENQASVAAGVITGRNGMILTPDDNIDATVTTIVNGPDDNPITKIDIAGTPTDISAGQVAKINMTAVAAGTYAYVYDYSTDGKTETNVYQPIAVEVGTTDVEGVKYISNTDLGTWDDETTAAHYTDGDDAEEDYLYFSITTNGGASKTYSFISVDDKIGTALPDGLLKLPAGQLSTGAASEKAAANTFYFTIYKRNDGKYAVKVIKIVV